MTTLAWCWAHRRLLAEGALALYAVVVTLLLRWRWSRTAAPAPAQAATLGDDAARQEARGETLAAAATRAAAKDAPLATTAAQPLPPVTPDPRTLSAAEHVRLAIEEARRGGQ